MEEFTKKPMNLESLMDVMLCAVPIWMAVMIGLMIGWSWRPRWAGLIFLGLRTKFRFLWTVPPGLGVRRLCIAFSAVSVGRKLWSNFNGNGEESSSAAAKPGSTQPGGGDGDEALGKEQDIVTEKDLEHLLHLLEQKVGEVAWQNMMDRSIPNMAYQAWRHVPETGPTILRSRTVFEDASPEMVRDFFWDDEFRPKWDPMLVYFKTLEEYPHNGTMIVHWIKKFPFFCGDREYIIGRRIWESGKTYYCVTKGVPYSGIQNHDKPWRVELYYSSWVIKAVESRKGDGQLSACEVTLVHYEDMGLPKDMANLGVRHGMWGTVKKLHSGFRAYQLARKSGASLSRSALMARITTGIPVDENKKILEPVSGEEEKVRALDMQRKIDHGINLKWTFVGGVVVLVFGLQTGVIGKALLFGAARRRARR